MIRVLRTFGVILTVGLLGYAATLVFDPEAKRVVDRVVAESEQQPEPPSPIEARHRRLERVARGWASQTQRPIEPEPNDPPSSELAEPVGAAIDPKAARDSFAYVMQRVDEIVRAGQRLEGAQWDSLYRESNDAFAALSIALDVDDEAQLAELEQAHRQLKQGLAKVRVRGGRPQRR